METKYSLTIRNRAAATLFAVGIIGLGAVFLTLGFALLLALVVAGSVLGAGVAVYRLIRGGSRALPSGKGIGQFDRTEGLDPALEIQPVRPAIVRPRDESD